jgi:hypothetical protein
MYPSADGTPPKYDRDSTAVKDFLKDVTLLMGSLTARMVGAVASGQYATWRKHLEALKGCETWSSELNGCAPTICKPLHATDLAQSWCAHCSCWYCAHTAVDGKGPGSVMGAAAPVHMGLGAR